MRIVSVQGVLPEYRYRQAEITEAFTHSVLRIPDDEAIVRRLHANAGAQTRHLALPWSATANWPTSPRPTTRSSTPRSRWAPGRSPTR